MEFRDLKSQYEALKPEIDKAILEIVGEGNYIMGKQVEELETNLAEYVGVRHAITCANGTDALTLAFMALEIVEGDAVFVPDFTFFATGETVSYAKATPIFVDVCEDTFNIDPEKLEIAIKKVISDGELTLKAVVPVDLFGLPANYDKIEKIAKKYNLKIIEDAAQGFGGEINGKKACSFGDIATTSFFPAKPLGCYGDGGAIFTNDDEIANRIKSLRIHGKGDDKYDNVRIGMNSRLDTVQASVLLVKLKAFTAYELSEVNRVAKSYTEKLQNTVKTPIIPNAYLSSFAQYTIILKDKTERDKLQETLKQNGIPSMIYYPKPMHEQTAFAYLKEQIDQADYSVTNRLCECVLSLPMHPYLSEQDIVKICDVIKK